MKEKMTSRICIFGASGATGLSLTRQAVERGYDVVAFVRSAAAKENFPPDVTVMVGDLLERSDVEHALTGCEAVLCAISQGPSSSQVFCAEATQIIIEAMKAQNIRRLIWVTGAMIGDYPYLSWFMRSMKNSYQKQQPALAKDRAEQEQRIAICGLDWNVVKPPQLTNGTGGGRFKSGESLKVGAMSSISRVDLSRFILDEMAMRRYVGKRVVVLV